MDTDFVLHSSHETCLPYISIFCFAGCSSTKKQVVDTSFLTSSSKQFFNNNRVVNKIEYHLGTNGSRTMYVYPKTIWLDSTYKKTGFDNYEYYDFNFLGDRYLFEKKYSALNLPEREMNIVLKKSCNPYSYLNVIADADCTRCVLEYYCSTKNERETDDDEEEEKVFIKVENKSRYKKGMKDLAHQMETAFKKKYVHTEKHSIDSVLIFKILIDNRDSCLKRIELIVGGYSSFTKIIMDELINSCSWIPSEQGGRPVKSYNKIFVRLNKDRSITAAMPE